VSLTAAELGPDGHDRRAALAVRLDATRSRIGAACAAAGRDPAEITLIAVTKTYPAADVLALASLGLTDFGENRDQEAGPKAAAVAQAGQQVAWHFIGQLQSNKAHGVAQYARYVHSVDRPRLVRHLGAAAADVPGHGLAGDVSLVCLIQVSLDGDSSRGGARTDQLLPLAEQIHREPGLALGGLMAVAPRDADPRAAFAPLRQLSELLRTVSPSAGMISAGMSGDLEAAVENGATHLRIGTALLGNRTLPVR
jgi:pyridoxal phosphate enzyme (YggS family)